MIDVLKFKMLRISESKGLILMIVIFAIFGMVCLAISGMTMYLIITPIVGGGIASNSLMLDERYHMNYYVDVMPFSRRNMVNAEYITAVITTVLSMSLILILTTCLMKVFGWTADPDIIDCGLKNNLDVISMILFSTTGMALTFNSIFLAGFYYGMNRMLAMGLGFLPVIFEIAMTFVLTGGVLKTHLIVFAIGVAAFAVSWHKSIGRNEKRDM